MKSRILEKGTELFFRYGVKTVTMDAIASELGISKKTIYQHFPDKDSMVFEKYFPKAFQLFTEHGEKCIHKNLIADFKKGAQFGYFRNDIDFELLARLRMAEVDLAFNPDFYPNNKLSLYDTQLTLMDIFMRGILTEKGLTLYTSYQNNLK